MELLEAHNNNRVLIVDDQPEIHDDFAEILTSGPGSASTDQAATDFFGEPTRRFLPTFDLLHATGGEKACNLVRDAKAENRPIAVAYVDIRMPPGIDGIETTRRMRAMDSDIEVVIMTAYTDKPLSEIVHGMTSLHKLLYIRKPFAREEIQQITRSLVGKWNIEQALAERQRLLTASHRRLEAVLDATGDAMAMYDTERRLVFANKGYEELCGLSEDELKALTPEALAARFKERFREPVLPAPEGRFFYENRDSLVQEIAAGQLPRQRLFYQSAALVHDGRQDVMGHLMVYRDVSREIEVEQMKAEVLRLRTELENAIERAILLETTGVLQVKNLPPELSPAARLRQGSPLVPTAIAPLAETERQAIADALDSSAHITAAARALGVSRATLYRKLKKYGLPATS